MGGWQLGFYVRLLTTVSIHSCFYFIMSLLIYLYMSFVCSLVLSLKASGRLLCGPVDPLRGHGSDSQIHLRSPSRRGSCRPKLGCGTKGVGFERLRRHKS